MVTVYEQIVDTYLEQQFMLDTASNRNNEVNGPLPFGSSSLRQYINSVLRAFD